MDGMRGEGLNARFLLFLRYKGIAPSRKPSEIQSLFSKSRGTRMASQLRLGYQRIIFSELLIREYLGGRGCRLQGAR